MKRTGIARHRSQFVKTALFCAGLVSIEPCFAANKKQSSRPTRTPSTPTSRPKATPPKGVVARYSQAMQLYDAGQFAEALVAFDQIHRAYPAHEPTVIQYAKTLYRLDRIAESYNLFARVNPQYLDPETSYEYGFSFYTQNKFDGALYSFKKVPIDHALYDLASYYGAMCALRLKRYGEAEDLLDKAVVLPDKLARSKTLYQKHITSLRQLQEKTDLERATADERQRIIAEQNRLRGLLSAPSGSTTSQGPQASAATAYEHKGFFEVVRLGRLKATKTTQESDLHGYSRKSYQSQSGVFSLSSGPLVPLPLKMENGRQAAVGLQLDLAVTSVTTTGIQQRLVAYEDSRDIVHSLTEQLPKQTNNLGDASISTWIESPMPSGWWIGGNGHLSFTYPNFERGQRYGIRGGTAHLGWKNNRAQSRSVKLTGTYDVIVDSDAEPVTGQSLADLAISAATTFDMNSTLGVKYVSHDYKLPSLPGPDTSTSLYATIVQTFPLGMKISFNGAFEQQKNYIVRNIGAFASASADGQILTGSAKLSAAPFTWLAIEAKYARSQSTWSVLQPDRTQAFKAVTPSYTETTDLVGSINLLF
jgi:tetratricopeptide (TPR) repeat protein